jgi:prephenate dehydratase
MRNGERMIKVAFQGEKGAYSEDAAYHYWSKNIEPIAHNKFKDIFNSVKLGQCDFGMIPIENSLTGSIHQNIDLLLDFHLSIVGEIILRIKHHLLALPNVRFRDIKSIYSHPQAIEQCSNFLETLQNVDIVPMYDTAGSARFLVEKNKSDSASIASSRAGQDYGLHVLKKEIENNHQNFTRFLIIANTPIKPKKDAKTSIVFSTKDIPGALFKALSVFSLRDINLLKIESRPLRKGPWKYWFYLDFDGSMQEESCQNAINHLKEITSFIKILGSYPKGRIVS